jgi:hypothetical protein
MGRRVDVCGHHIPWHWLGPKLSCVMGRGGISRRSVGRGRIRSHTLGMDHWRHGQGHLAGGTEVSGRHQGEREAGAGQG